MARIYAFIASIIIACFAVFFKFLSSKFETKTFGLNIHDIDLCDIANITPSLIANLSSLVYENGYIILKNQCKEFDNKINAETLDFIGKHFGESRFIGQSVKGSHYITPLGNNGSEKFRKIGSQAWHIDTLTKYKPSSIVLMYVQSAPNIGYGGTRYIHSANFLDEVQTKYPSIYELWNRIFFVSGETWHPVIALHPVSNEHYLIIRADHSQQMIEALDLSIMQQMNEALKGQKTFNSSVQALISSYIEANKIKIYSETEKEEMFESIEHLIENSPLMHVATYEDGDLFIRDNFAMLHMADPTAQLPVEEIGLRSIWTIEIKAKHPTTKY